MAPAGSSGRGQDRLPPALRDALADLDHASRTPPKARRTEARSTIDAICDTAYENGLPRDALDAILNIITLPNHLDQASIGKLVRSLYPATKVHDGAIVKVIGCLGQGQYKPGAPAQAALLKWLIQVYEVVQNRGVVAQFYGVLFNLLNTYSLRAQLCHLLALITRRKHVRPFRIQTLLELSRTAVNEPHLIGLIRVYKDYYPDVIVGTATAGRASVFAHPDPDWRARVHAILEANAQDSEAARSGQDSFKVVRLGAKRGKVLAVPEVYTSHATEKSVTLDEINDVDEFVRKLEKIQLPDQIIAVLSDPLLQKYLTLKPDPGAERRLEAWLTGFFEEVLYGIDLEEDRLSGVLDCVLIYARYTKELPRAYRSFLGMYLQDWDGLADRAAILESLAFLPMSPFNLLQATFLSKLERAVLADGRLESKIEVLQSYTALLRQFTVRLLSSSSHDPDHNADHGPETFSALIRHADALCLDLIETRSPVPVHATSAALSFYEAVAAAIEKTDHYTTIRITAPSSLLIYLLAFTPSLSTLSRLCAILATYKRAFEGAMAAAQTDGRDGMYPRAEVNHFNGFLMDICNCIWRNRAFNREDANAHGCLVSERLVRAIQEYVEAQEYALPALFSLSHATTLCGLSIACFRELEDAAAGEIAVRHAGPVTQRSLARLGEEGGLKISWSNYRLEVIQWLDERGVKGVGELMYNTMKHLLKVRGGSVGGMSPMVFSQGSTNGS